jgi:class 3 adenylate cyclase/tetratricopeptide (TPR) repeat protein
MKCTSCGLENPEGFVHCGGCGRKLITVCPNCAAELPAGFSFCGRCGVPLDAPKAEETLISTATLSRLAPFFPPQALEDLPPLPLWEREHVERVYAHLTTLLEVVSAYLPRHLIQAELAPGAPPIGATFLQGALLFADISGFTALSERLSALGQEGAEQITSLVNSYFDAMLQVLFSYGGDLLKFGGDALLAFFPEPGGGCTNAVRAALAMREAMQAFRQVKTAWGTFALRMKIGLHCGSIVAARVGTAEKGFVVTGPEVNVTARVEGLAKPGQVLATRSICQAVEQHEWLSLDEGPAGHYLLHASEPALLQRADSMPPVNPAISTLPVELGGRLHETLHALERLTPYLPQGLIARLVTGSVHGGSRGEHRLVTVLFSKFVGASQLVARLGPDRPDEIAQAIHQYYVTVHRTVARYGGTINKVDLAEHGDKLMALFGAPVSHEDDAERAVRAALEMQAAFDTQCLLPQSQSIGLSTGLVFAGQVGGANRREYTVMGDEVNLAARLMDAAGDGEILLSAFVGRKVSPIFELADRGRVTLKGKSKPVPVFTIVGRRAQPEPVRGIRGLRSPLVGRDMEEETLQRLVKVLRTGRGSIVTLTGDAGLGKSRLVAELRGRVLAAGDVAWLEGRCLSYTQQVSYSAFTDAIQAALGIVDTDNESDVRVKLQHRVSGLSDAETAVDILPYLARFLGLPPGRDADRLAYLDSEALQRQVFRAVAVFLELLAGEQPLVLAFDDLQWADSASLALLERCLSLTDKAPVLILLIFRPERAHGCWALGETAARDYPHRHTGINLSPLDPTARQDEELVCNLLALDHLPAGLVQLIRRAEGNPFYVEEIIRTLIDHGAIVRKNRQWQLVRDVDYHFVPDTLQGIIMARLDRLTEAPRSSLQLASVLGRTFRHHILAWLASAAALAAQLDASLATLQRNELIRERRRLPELEFIFKHVMIRDVAYESLLVKDRRAYHRLAAHYLERTYLGQKLEENVELLAHHYSHSDNDDKALIYLIKAGEKARAAYANPEAMAFFHQAEALEEKMNRTAERAVIAEGLADVLFHTGEFDAALAYYRQALRACAHLCDRADLYCHIGTVLDKRGDYDAALSAYNQGLDLLADHTGAVGTHPDDGVTPVQARLLAARSRIYHHQGQFEAALGDASQSLSLVSGTTHYRELFEAHNALGNIYERYSQPARSIAHYEQAQAILEHIGDEHGAARIYNNLAIIYYQTDLNRSADYFTRSLNTMRRLGDVWGESTALQNLGIIHYARGDYAKAIDFYRHSLSMKQRLGDSLGIADCRTNLGETYRAQGESGRAIVELEEALAIAQEIGAGQAELECHRQLAECYLEIKDFPRAVASCKQVLDHARTIGDRKEEGVIHRVLGRAYHRQGNTALAVEHLEQAVNILQELNREFDLAPAWHDYGLALGQAGRLDEARKALSRAQRLFERLGLGQEQTRVEAALRDLPPD